MLKYKLKRGNVYYFEECYFNSIFDKLKWMLGMKLNGWKITLVRDNNR